MKRIYLIATITLLTFANCKQKESTDKENTNDSIAAQDTTMIESIKTDSTMVDSMSASSDIIRTETITTTGNLANGKRTLAETKWKLVEMNGKAISAKNCFINLDSKSGKFAGNGGCNNFSGVYFMKDTDMLAFSKIISTKMACASMDTESQMIMTLGKVDKYMVENKMLMLMKGSKTLAKFEASK